MNKEYTLKHQSMKLIGNSIRARRIKLGLNVAELAERSNIHDNTLSKIERAESEPTYFTLKKIAAGLGLDSSLELLSDSNHDVYPILKEWAKNKWE